ncbi:hypothetical protein EYF80_068434 [Liparis tanakae]|uniref:Uncharacterized protein n=1 Tax=Liparis tanakae TaxID=230148 RepID=A0A4Z2DY23_9TELE|nr:hypothetical protein EYF80_068434 [Liparis tanakae]
MGCWSLRAAHGSSRLTMCFRASAQVHCGFGNAGCWFSGFDTGFWATRFVFPRFTAPWRGEAAALTPTQRGALCSPPEASPLETHNQLGNKDPIQVRFELRLPEVTRQREATGPRGHAWRMCGGGARLPGDVDVEEEAMKRIASAVQRR